MTIESQLESLLFITTKPLSVQQLARLTQHTVDEVRTALARLMTTYNTGQRGIRLLENGNEYQMTTAPEHATLVADFVEDDLGGELTRPQLETLTVIAYRGPITKTALERVRGVHCGLILRNLLLRGLIHGEEDATKLQTHYSVTMDFLRALGVASVRDLPDYETLHRAEAIDQLLAGNETQ